MAVVDEHKLNEYRAAGKCFCCGKSYKVRVPHHLIRRGMSGAFRFDVDENLESMCKYCHDLFHHAKGDFINDYGTKMYYYLFGVHLSRYELDRKYTHRPKQKKKGVNKKSKYIRKVDGTVKLREESDGKMG